MPVLNRVYSHQNRSGISRLDLISRKTNPDMESLESFLGVKCRRASGGFLTKDHRHKRVFSREVDSSPEEENEEENEDRKKLLRGFDASTNPDDAKENGFESGIVRSETENKIIDGANGLNLKDQEIPGKGPLPKIKMALSGCRRRKVYKTPSSFSYKRLLPHLMDIINDTSSLSEIEIVDAGSPCKFPKLNGVNFRMRSVVENSYAAKAECVALQFNDLKPSEYPDLEKDHVELLPIQTDLSTADNDGEEKSREDNVNGIDVSAEEHIQTTPPDIDHFAKVEDDYVGGSVDANKVLAENKTFVGLPIGREKNGCGPMKQSPNTRCGTNSVNPMVLNPCSRLKLFTNPRSLSYRRLLPFLMDVSRKSSCSSRKPQQELPQLVSETASAVQDNANNAAKQDYEKKCSEDLVQNNSLMVPLPASDSSPSHSSNHLVSSTSESSATSYSSIVSPRSVNIVNLPDLRMLNSLPIKEIPRSENKPTKLQLDIGSKERSTVSERSSIVINGIVSQQCTSEGTKSVEKQKKCLRMGLELHNGNAESIVNMDQDTFQVKASDASVSPNNRPFKGILKRNRQGCRGLCNCLNCTSFRLHAERAFEFSRNQLHEAGEVALDLMKELVNLRLLLQKSITETDYSSTIRPDQVLIEQAFNKALEAETLAKERLDELNDDLRVHCKTPVLMQPKVTFARDIVNK